MGYFTDTAKALRTTLANAFREPVTSEFPIVIRPRAERFRVSFALIDDEHGEIACVGCLACERICPSHVIKMKSAGKKDSPVTGKKRAYVEAFTLDLSACIGCELCVQVCNSDALTMVREPEVPAFTREDLVLDMGRLRANANEKPYAWGKGTRLQGMQEAPKAEKVAPPAAVAAAPSPAAPAPAASAPAAPAPAAETPAEPKETA